ncbi:unnamed protein product [Orchesella dallaii]|uniref:F-box domain-containing protein n=1 Tax=Orchesella dallaii TaxID=48710 RepID=A0ABP1QIJ5_9HEXA
MGSVESLPVKPVVLPPPSSSSSSPNGDEDNLIIEEIQNKPVICYATNDDFSQELSLFPELVWKIIIGYVMDSNTIFALLNTSPYFHQEVKEILLFQAALPHMMKNASLNLSSTLECRLLSTTTKSTIDNKFRSLRKVQKSFGRTNDHTPGPYSFHRIPNPTNFINHFESIPNLSGNPFINDCLKLWVSFPHLYDTVVIQLLTRFGPLIRELELTIEILDHPSTLMLRLIEALTLVPNLERLLFRFLPFPGGMKVFYGDTRYMVDLARIVPVPTADFFPTLPRLSEIDIMVLEKNDSGVNHSMLEATREMLLAYGQQLSVFKCGNETIQMNIPEEFFSQNIGNLRELTLCGFEGNLDTLFCFTKLSTVRLPRLTRLNLELIGKKDMFPRITRIYDTFLTLLNNLQHSLEELYVWRSEGDKPLEITNTVLFPPPTVIVLPKLKRLTLQPPDVNHDGTFWTELQPRLRNLECVEFRSGNVAQVPNETLALPEVGVRNTFFQSFPKLNQFVWKELNMEIVKTTVISRMDSAEGKKRVIIEQIPYIRQVQH